MRGSFSPLCGKIAQNGPAANKISARQPAFLFGGGMFIADLFGFLKSALYPYFLIQSTEKASGHQKIPTSNDFFLQ
jgi:hypothetical protein